MRNLGCLLSAAALVCLCNSATQGLLNPITAGGTLVVATPFDGGIVFAADSRKTVWRSNGNKFCDGIQKVFSAATPNHIAYAVPGDMGIVASAALPNEDLCQHLRVAPRILDIERLAGRFLEVSNVSILRLDIRKLAQECADKVAAVGSSYPDLLKRFAGKNLFSVVIAGYVPDYRGSVITGLTVYTEQDGSVRFRVWDARYYLPDYTVGYLTFGETEYVEKETYKSNFYDETFWKKLEGKKVREVTVEEAVAFSTHLIEATSKATEVIAAASGIGGPINTLVVDRKDRPELFAPPSK